MKKKKEKTPRPWPKKIVGKAGAGRPKYRKKTIVLKPRRLRVREKVRELPKIVVTAREPEKRPRKFPNLVWLAAVLALAALLVIVMVRRENKIKQTNLELRPYVGQYRFEVVSDQVKQKVGDQVNVEVRDGLLAIRLGSSSSEIRLLPESDGDFQEVHSDYEVTFLKDSEGNILGMTTKYNKNGISFTLLKVE